jgi:hypothetical protein
MSADGDVFAWSQHRVGRGDENPVYFLIWRKSTDQVLYHMPTKGLLDKVGGWIRVVGMLHCCLQAHPADKTYSRVPGRSRQASSKTSNGIQAIRRRDTAIWAQVSMAEALDNWGLRH